MTHPHCARCAEINKMYLEQFHHAQYSYEKYNCVVRDWTLLNTFIKIIRPEGK
jgi:hypothetical protein